MNQEHRASDTMSFLSKLTSATQEVWTFQDIFFTRPPTTGSPKILVISRALAASMQYVRLTGRRAAALLLELVRELAATSTDDACGPITPDAR